MASDTTLTSAPTLREALIDMLEQFERVDFTGEKKAVIERAHAALELHEPSRPDILERLSYHALERDDVTLDDCLDVLANGWKKVRGRTERQMVMQIMALLAGQPHQPAQQVDGATMAGLVAANGHLSTLLDESTLMLSEVRQLVDDLHKHWSPGGPPERGEFPLLDRVDDWLGARPPEMLAAAQQTKEGPN